MPNREVKRRPGEIDDVYFCDTMRRELQLLADEYKKKSRRKFFLKCILKTELLVVTIFLAPLLACLVFLKDNDIISSHYLTALFVLITLLLLLFVFLYNEIEDAQKNEFLRKINEAAKLLSPRNIPKKKKEDDCHLSYLSNSHFIFIKRNGRWELLPTNLLIQQDLFLLRAGDLIPCSCVEYNLEESAYGRRYEKYEVFMPMDKDHISMNLLTRHGREDKRDYLPSFHLYSFVAQEDVSISTIKRYMQNSTDESKISKHKGNLRNVILTEKIHTFYLCTWVVLFLLCGAAAAVYFADMKSHGEEVPHFVIMYFLLYSVLMSLTMLPFFHRIFSELIHGYCSSLNLVYESYFKDEMNCERNFSSSFDFSTTTEDTSYADKKRFGLFYTLKSIFFLIIRGIKIDKCYLNILSDCSVLCFLDSSGLLIDSNHSIKEICLYNHLNTKKEAPLSSTVTKGAPTHHNYILTVIDILMDNKSMYAYQRIKNRKILHALFLLSYYTQLPKYIRLLDEFQNNIVSYMNQVDYSHLFICLCDIGNLSYPYNKFVFHKLFLCVENKSNYELYKKKSSELKKHKKGVADGGELKKREKVEANGGELPYHVHEHGEKGHALGINIYDAVTSRDNFVFAFILCEKKKDKYHLFLKGQLDALVNKCMFYYDGKAMKRLKRRKKKVLRILNMQWISSGIESICFAYRPLSTEERNYMKDHFQKNIYILTIDKRKVYHLRNFNNESPFPAKANEKFLSHLLSTSIFIGNSAVKLMTNSEIQTRINDIYNAGIRFVHFSKTDQANTRNVSNLLGMETNWNTSISLSLNDKSSFKNRDGKVVIPSGINNIKTHIQEVDDIPLRVSSYSGCNQFNTAEMIKILLDNNEIITCVGNSLNCCNFEMYSLCNYAVSILLPYNNACKDCQGKRERNTPFDELSTKQNPIIAYASFVNTLPCNLIVEKRRLDLSENIMELVYKLLKSSRIHKKNVSLTIFFFYFYYSQLSFLLFIISVFFLPPLISVMDYLLFILLIIPLLSIALLGNDNNGTIMNEIPDRVITREFLLKRLLFYLIRWIPFLLFCITLPVYYVKLINKEFASRYLLQSTPSEDVLSSFPKGFLADVTHHCTQSAHLSSLYKCQLLLYSFPETEATSLRRNMAGVMIKQSQIFFFFVFSLLFFVSSLSHSDRFEPLYKLSCVQNSKTYFSCLFIFLILSLLYVALRVYMLPPYYAVQLPDATLGILTVIFSLIILATNETLKRVEARIKTNRQKYLKVLFGTRLGMWSPK
ncbi:TMEM94 domain-containing protein, putative [Plasmodium vivax]|nr:TMEM94 domain-containing protein, putative [Plasmodium vivax]